MQSQHSIALGELNLAMGGGGQVTKS